METLDEILLMSSRSREEKSTKSIKNAENDVENLTLNVSTYPQVMQINESVISTKNDPDYIQLTKSQFEINKNYMELITK